MIYGYNCMAGLWLVLEYFSRRFILRGRFLLINIHFLSHLYLC